MAAGATITGLASGSVSLGGSGGSGGSGGAIKVENETSLKTQGNKSTGILAKSVGGGGGTGGFSVSAAATFKSPDKNSFTASVSLGGQGGDGNTAGAVRVANAAQQIATKGGDAPGIVAQSTGGGGGTGGFSGSLALNLAPQDNKFFTEGDSVSLGGSGGTGNTGGAVTVNSVGSISTQGDGSYGLYAQSVGGAAARATAATTSCGPEGKSINIKRLK